MKIAEIRNLSREELTAKIASLKEDLGKLNTQRVTGQVDKPHLFRSTRKTIARMLTVVSEIDRGVAAPAPRAQAVQSKSATAKKRVIRKRAAPKA